MIRDNVGGAVDTATGLAAVPVEKWGALASFLMAVSFLVAPLIYLVGNLRDPLGPLGYDLADLLYGPVWGASLVVAVFALRERIGALAQRRMSLALLAAVLAAGAMVLVACIRASNRHYHLLHPELNLENSQTVLVVWATLVAGVTGAGWHFLGWALLLSGSAGWASGRVPRALCVLYLVAGGASLFVYLFAGLEGFAVTLGMVWAVWQGIVLWRGAPGETPTPQTIVSRPG